MSRVKISEFKAKSMIFPLLGKKYDGTNDQSADFPLQNSYVVKVDQGIKKRYKQGLMLVNVKGRDVKKSIKGLASKGYSNFIIEKQIDHDSSEEKFLALERTREGISCTYSNIGGIDIESNKESVKKVILNEGTTLEVSHDLGFDIDELIKLENAFDDLYISFLEINPLLVINKKILPLDLAVEVDSAAEFFVNGAWSNKDFINNQKAESPEESEIKKLADNSSASFKLVMLNPNGSIFTIFSGGGASIVLADEIDNMGNGDKLANYAEYSGGPTEEETYIFTKNIISLMLKSTMDHKKLYIAGGVANFTDIRATFKGVIRALDEKKAEMKKQNIKVYVRRGGPYQEEGLKLMYNFLDNSGLLGEVMGPDRVLTDVVTTN